MLNIKELKLFDTVYHVSSGTVWKGKIYGLTVIDEENCWVVLKVNETKYNSGFSVRSDECFHTELQATWKLVSDLTHERDKLFGEGNSTETKIQGLLKHMKVLAKEECGGS